MKQKMLVVVVGIALSFIFMYFALRQLDLTQVSRLRGIYRSFIWLVPAIGCYLLGHVLRGARCRAMVSQDATLTLIESTNIVVLGYSVNNLLPARLGEFVRAGVLTERTGVSYVQSLTVTVAERFLDTIAILFFLVIATLLQPSTPLVMATLPFIIGMLILGLSMGIVFIMCPAHVLRLIEKLGSYVASSWWQQFFLLQVERIIHGLAYLRKPRGLLWIWLLSLAVWLLESGLFLFSLPVCGLTLNLPQALLVMSVTNLALLAPSMPGFIGTFHFFSMQVLVEMGVVPEVALAYAVLVHLGFYVPITFWGMSILIAYGYTVRKTLALSEMAVMITNPRDELGAGPQSKSESAESTNSKVESSVEEAGPFLVSIIGALLPLETYFSDRESQEGATKHVANFVHGQLAVLPFRLRGMFALGMLGFRVVTVLRHLIGFSSLPRRRQVAWVEKWAYGRVAILRQLFRVLRAPAMLSFFELPQVQASLALGDIHEKPSAELP